MGKYGDIPVNYYTGLPQIQLPLFTLTTGQLEVPLSLSYHASLKVDDQASWVGLGWSLSAGGVITRTMRGLPDEASNGYWSRPHPWSEPDWVPDNTFSDAVLNGRIDSEPDAFFYNLLSKSGSFAFQDATTGHAFADRQLLIHRPINTSTYIVTDANGTRYFFGTTSASVDQTQSTTESGDSYQVRRSSSASYLETIISADQADTVHFEYEPETLSYDLPDSETRFQRQSFGPGQTDLLPSHSTTHLDITQVKLRTIRSRNGRVEFLATTPRGDLAGGRSLDGIRVFTAGGQLVKQYDFAYDYFYPTQRATAPPEALRLKLLAVTERNGGVVLPAHRFQYLEHQPLPARGSYAQDHWGYANANTASTYIPKHVKLSNSRYAIIDGGANREPDFAASSAGLLHRITYPTGGVTRLYYEPHNASSIEADPAYALDTRPYELRLRLASEPGGNDSTQTLRFTTRRAGYAEVRTTCRLSGVKFEGDDGTAVAVFDQPSDVGSPSPIASAFYGCGCDTQRGNQTKSFVQTIPLDAGPHVLRIDLQLSQNVSSAEASIQVIVHEETDAPYPLGGARIRAITTWAQAGQGDSLRKTFRYTLSHQGKLVSSGVAVAEPSYDYPYKTVTVVPSPTGPGGTITVSTYTGFTSTAKAGLAFTQGSHVGYKQVEVEEGPAGQAGKTIYRYSAADGLGNQDYIVRSLPFPPAISRDYRRGLLLEAVQYDRNGLPVVRTRHTYQLDATRSNLAPGLALALSQSASQLTSRAYESARYYSLDQWVYQQSTATIRYATGDSTNQTHATTRFYYANPVHALRTMERETGPEGTVRTSRFTYPLDYAPTAADAPSQALLRLQQRHVLTPVIEQTQWLRQPGQPDSVLLGAALTQYALFPGHTGLVLPAKSLALDLLAPTKQFTAAQAGASGWRQDGRYREKVAYQAYDAHANLQQQQAPFAPPTVYLWGYGHTQPVAEVFNVTLPQVQAALQAEGLTEQELEKRTTDGVTTAAQLQAVFARLRARLPQARLSSFTYAPLVGVTSRTDPSGRTTFYEYDALGRLLRVRDEQGRILSQQEYKYAAQP